MWPLAPQTAALASCGGNPELLAGKEDEVGVQMAGGGSRAARGSGQVGPASLLSRHRDPLPEKLRHLHALVVVRVAVTVCEDT